MCREHSYTITTRALNTYPSQTKQNVCGKQTVFFFDKYTILCNQMSKLTLLGLSRYDIWSQRAAQQHI